jgi:hypothetical protein
MFGRFDRENNIDESKIVFIHGRIEDVNLPVEKVKKIFNNFENLNLLNFLRLILSFPNGWVRQFMKGIIIRMRNFFLGYFLLFECMLESIIFARNTYLDKENGLGKLLNLS